jgi:hypothetical protein
MEHPNRRRIPSQLLHTFLICDGPCTDGRLTLQDFIDGLGDTAGRIYTHLITLALFLRQVVLPDHACQAAVETLNALRIAAGLSECSEDNSGYCKARGRLLLEPIQRLFRLSARRMLETVKQPWLFHGRVVKIVDGTGCSMPDSPANRVAFPLPGGQKKGIGFPMARVFLVVSLACGAALAAAISRCRGKQTGECAAMRRLHAEGQIERGDILLGDNLYGTFLDIALLVAGGIDVVFGLHAQRKVDFRTGERLGPEDHRVEWTKPKRPEWLDQETYDRLPETMTVRELRIRIVRAGFRTRVVTLVTTLVDAEEFTRAELAALAKTRWHVELDIRSLKHALAMDVLRCETPEMVEQEIWVHLLGYNLIRGAMAAAAAGADVLPRVLSFTGARRTLEAFANWLSHATTAEFAAQVSRILRRVARYEVGDRSGRFEPRERKRRHKRGK